MIICQVGILLCYFVIPFPLEMEGLDIFQQRHETLIMYDTFKDITDHAGAAIFTEVIFTFTLHIMTMTYDYMSGRD